MGSDGAKGLLKMRQAGSYTIGQDKDSCVVYGMPMVSFNIGGVVKQLPLERINAEIIQYCNSKAAKPKT
jgi:two-component system chemotaxis response regulator CheB